MKRSIYRGNSAEFLIVKIRIIIVRNHEIYIYIYINLFIYFNEYNINLIEGVT